MAMRLQLTNWMCHRELSLEFQSPVNLVVSENMAGKTAIRDSLEFAIAGTGFLRGITTKKDLASYSIFEDEPSCEVDLAVKGPNDTVFHVIRRMDRKGAQQIEVGTDRGMVKVKKLGDAQDKIWELLQLNERQLRAVLAADFLFVLPVNERRSLVSSVLGDAAIDLAEIIDQLMRREISEEDAKEFAEIIKTDGWGVARETAESLRAGAKAKISGLGQKPQVVETFQPPWRTDPVDFRRFTVADVEQRLQILRESIRKNDERLARGKGATEAKLQQLEREQSELQAELAEIQADVEVDVENHERLAQQAQATFEEKQNETAELLSEKQRLTPLAALSEALQLVKPDPCPAIPGNPKCPMTKAKLEAHGKKLREEQKASATQLQETEEKLVAAQQAETNARQELTAARERLEQEKGRAARIAHLNQRLTEMETQIEEESTRLADIGEETDAGDGSFLNQRMEQGQMMLNARQEYDRQVQAAATYDEKLAKHRAERDRYDRIAQALKPDQVESVFLDRVLGPMREALEMFGKRFGGVRIDQEFNVELYWEERWRRWQQLSESGRLRVGYAVQFAFSKLSGFPVLAIDQIDHLDSAGKYHLLETLRDVSPEFACVLGLATLQRPKPAPAPIQNVVTWYLTGGIVSRVR